MHAGSVEDTGIKGWEGSSMPRISRVQQLRDEGFDQSTYSGLSAGRPSWRPKCSQCEVLVINGTACHETGCSNQTFECRGCNAEVPRRGMYCEDCQ